MTEIRVLAVRQPWASLIVEGLKTIEVRSRPTNIRGRVAIYASSKIGTLNDIDFVFNSLGAMKTFEDMGESDKIKFNSVYKEYKELTGVIIGTVEIGSIEPSNKDLHWDMRRYHFAPMNKGEYYWNLSNPVKFSSLIPYKPPKGCVVWSKTEIKEA